MNKLKLNSPHGSKYEKTQISSNFIFKSKVQILIVLVGMDQYY